MGNTLTKKEYIEKNKEKLFNLKEVVFIGNIYLSSS